MTVNAHNPGSGRLEGGLRVQGISLSESTPGKPVISVVTVVRNGEHSLEQTIQSVLQQTYGAIEYIVIDGASTDGTLDIIKKYERKIAYWISEPDKGIYDAMNKGISASSGELINLLNADDYLEPNAVELVVAKYLDMRKSAIIYGHAFAVDDRYSVKAPLFSRPAYWLGMTINHQSMFVHRKIYESIGLYDIQYRAAADYDFLVRSFRNNVPFELVEACIVNYRNSGVSFTSTRHREESNIINKKQFGTWSKKRWAFIMFNYAWMPVKLSLRTFLYEIIGVKRTRMLISLYKKIFFSKPGWKQT